MKSKIPLKLYKTKSYEGYDSKDVSAWLAKNSRGEQWAQFSAGMTGGIYKGHFIVYSWDLENFLAGGVNND